MPRQLSFAPAMRKRTSATNSSILNLGAHRKLKPVKTEEPIKIYGKTTRLQEKMVIPD